MRRWVVLLACAFVAVPAFGQSPDLKELLAGSAYPLTVKLGDLNGEWRRFGTSGSGDLGGLGAMYSAMFGGGAGMAYYTRGQVVTANGETYLVAYRPATKPMSFAAIMRSGSSGPPPPEKLTANSVLYLSLLNLRTAGSLVDIRPFNLQQEVAESEGVAATATSAPGEAQPTAGTDTSSTNRLKQLGLAVAMYCQDYDEVLPPTNTEAAAQKALMPYVKSRDVFVQPETKKPYRVNPALSHKKLAHISQPAAMVVYYESTAAADRTRGVAFLDGHTARVPENEWARLKRASKIP